MVLLDHVLDEHVLSYDEMVLLDHVLDVLVLLDEMV